MLQLIYVIKNELPKYYTYEFSVFAYWDTEEIYRKKKSEIVILFHSDP
jgi:hypothetical protein